MKRLIEQSNVFEFVTIIVKMLTYGDFNSNNTSYKIRKRNMCIPNIKMMFAGIDSFYIQENGHTHFLTHV